MSSPAGAFHPPPAARKGICPACPARIPLQRWRRVSDKRIFQKRRQPDGYSARPPPLLYCSPAAGKKPVKKQKALMRRSPGTEWTHPRYKGECLLFQREAHTHSGTSGGVHSPTGADSRMSGDRSLPPPGSTLMGIRHRQRGAASEGGMAHKKELSARQTPGAEASAKNRHPGQDSAAGASYKEIYAVGRPVHLSASAGKPGRKACSPDSILMAVHPSGRKQKNCRIPGRSLTKLRK